MTKQNCMFRLAITVLLACQSIVLNAQELWYQTPANFFEEALVIGNGRLGGIVYGGVKHDRISLNDITLWSGEPEKEPVNPNAYKQLPAVREALAREDYRAADSIAMLMQGHEQEMYMPLGVLNIRYPQHDKPYTNYRRSLSLATATALTSYNIDGYTYTTEYFASSPDSCIVVKLSTNAPQGLFAEVALESEMKNMRTAEGSKIFCDGYAPYTAKPFFVNGNHKTGFLWDENRGIHFRTIVNATAKDGKITAANGELKIDGCHEVVLTLVNSTSFNGPFRDPVKDGIDYKAEANRNIAKALKKGYKAIRKAQQKDYQALYNRVSLNLGATSADIKALPTDKQLLSYTDRNEANPELEATYFQFGRYLLISASRTPGIPANLQGLWSEPLYAPWNCGYTVNINLEENYWGAETTNLSEMHQPLISFVSLLPKDGVKTAAAYFDVHKGWCCNHNTDIWAITNPVGEGVDRPQWANWPFGGAWMSTHIWEQYMFSQNKEQLQQNYETLRGAAEFCMAWLVEKDGELITNYSTTPENQYRTPSGYVGDTFYGGSADLALVRECVGDAAKAARVLGVDADFVARAESTLARLRPYKIGKRGQLLEWYHDWDDADWTHRHQSHLIGLYPGHHITPAQTPELANAAARSLEIKGDKTTGWSTGWRINLLARLQKNAEAYHMVRTLLKAVSPDGYRGKDARRGGGTYPNMLDAHSPFQIDGNFGGSAGIAEMLVQSNENEINLLPARPEEWGEGSAKGLCARGGWVLDFAWSGGKITSLTVCARANGETKVNVNGKTIAVKMKKGDKKKLI